MRRILGWMCAVLMILTPVLSALSEGILAEDQKESMAVFYLHATGDETLIRTAKYVIFALDMKAKNEGREIMIDRMDDAQNTAVFKTADATTLGKMISKDRLSDGTGKILNEKLIEDLSGSSADIWMIIPEEACNNLMQNQEIMNQSRQMLSNPHSRIHLLMIGNEVREPGTETALYQFISEYQNRVEIIRLTTDFLAQKREFGSDGTIHTGDYFLASLFGQPADLNLIPSADGEWLVSLPQPGSIFVLQRYNNSITIQDPVLTDAQSSQRTNRTIQETFNLIYQSSRKDEINFAGALITQLPAGDYLLSGCVDGTSDGTKVYWYPDFSELQPVLDLGEDDYWTWGRQTVALSLGNVLNRPGDFEVTFTQKENDNTPIDWRDVQYIPERQAWERSFVVNQEIERVQITPQVTLCMQDGNQIWTWKGKSQARELKSSGVNIREGATDEATVYFTNNTDGTLTILWNDIFDYNPFEKPVFALEPDDAAKDRISINENEDEGFTLTIAPGEEGKGKLILKCNETEHIIPLAWKNANLILTTDIIHKETEHDPVSVGEEIGLKAIVGEEAFNELIEAFSQQNHSFPDPEGLRLSAWIQKDDFTDKKNAAFKRTEDGIFAEVRIPISKDSADGEYILEYHVTGDVEQQSVGMLEGELPVQIQNNIPRITYDGGKKFDICLEGMPGSYEEMDVLAEVFGEKNLAELFSDDETGIESLEIKVTNPTGLTLNDETSDEDWEITLTDPGEKAKIIATGPGDHLLTLNAYDGVNTSENLDITVHVYSKNLRIAMFAVAGIVALLLLLAFILMIIRIRKPKFDGIYLRCYSGSDEDADRGQEIMTKCQPVSMAHFRKKAVSLTDLLVLTRQPSSDQEVTDVTDDIMMLPTKHGEVNILYGKKAMQRIGRHEKRDLIVQNSVYRLRIDNTYIQIENVQ